MWLFLLFWAQCTHAQLNPFYHPFYPNVTHVRKDTRPSPRFTVLEAMESWAGPGYEASCHSTRLYIYILEEALHTTITYEQLIKTGLTVPVTYSNRTTAHVMYDHSLSLMQRKQHGYVFAKLCFQVKSYEDAFR